MGPCAGLLLADLGAEVIKVEPIEGDSTRRLPGFAAGFFATFNRNKHSIAVDLKRKEGQAVVRRLAEKADVLLENFGPGTIERLGCGWDDLKDANPRLIYLALKGYLHGPYENRGALDEVVQMQSGLAYMTGPPGRPLRAGAPIIDILGGVFGVVAVLAALRERDRTGKGQRVGSALYETAAFLMAPFAVGSAVTGEPMPPMPARKGAWGIYDVFTGSDGKMIFLGVTSDQHWQRFCEAFDLPHLFGDERLKTNPMRTEQRDWMLPQLQALMGNLPSEEIARRAEAAKLPWAKVGHPGDLMSDPQLLAGGLIETAKSVLGGGCATVAVPGLPLEFGDAKARTALKNQPPKVGQDARAVLSEAGFAPNEIEALLKDGVVKEAA
jgi:crotonobetainyl-CoA:carnitine CoA-transferase CaiB-like acyl-CoA transferase